MSKKAKAAASAAPEQKALTVVERAVVALGYSAETEKSLTELAGESSHIVEITNLDGYKQCHSARMKLKNTRLEIKARGETARDDATKFSKAVIGEQNRLVGFIQPEENRLQKLQDDYDAAIETEKRLQIEADAKRVSAIQRRIEDVRSLATLAPSASAADIRARIEVVNGFRVDERFEEYAQQALDVRDATICRLREFHANAVERERRDEQARKDREELERLRAENAERERQATAAAQTAPAAPTPPQMFDLPPAPTREEYESMAPPVAAPERTARFSRPAPERPSFDDIVETLAVCYSTTEDVVRSWICENVVMEAA